MTDNTHPISRFIGLLIIAASVLWMVFCGLCGAWMIFSVLTTSSVNAESLMGGLFVLAVSGAGAAVGYVFLLLGRGMSK